MNHIHSKKETALKWTLLALLVLIGTLFTALLIGQIAEAPTPQSNVQVDNTNDFRLAYPLAPSDHVFKEVRADRAVEILSAESGVIMLGFEECPWCQSIVPHLDASARESGIETVYYFNVRRDRTENTKTYQKFVTALEPNLAKDENGKPKIYVPHIVVVKNGSVVGDYKIALPQVGENDEKPTPETYWNATTIKATRDQLKQEFAKLSS